MGQMAGILTKRQQGSLLSNSEKNPKGDGREHVKTITLRSGTVQPGRSEARAAAPRGEASRDTGWEERN